MRGLVINDLENNLKKKQNTGGKNYYLFVIMVFIIRAEEE